MPNIKELLRARAMGLLGSNGSSGEKPVLEELSITENGEYYPSNGADGFSKVIAAIETGGVSEQEMLEAAATGAWPSGDIVINGDAVQEYAFRRSAITSVRGDNVTTLGTYCMSFCPDLTEVNFPLLTNPGSSYAWFHSCSKLAKANVPMLTTFPADMFNSCAFEEAVFPTVTTLERQAFRSCRSMKSADFAAVTSIKGMAFAFCTALKALILRSETICTLPVTDAFYQTAIEPSGTNSSIAYGTSYIYVPGALVDSYKAATNWTVFANQFRALEDYTVDGTITGEIDWMKIEAEETTE